jgi:DNA invertase Pin-like site-specific DNA recombinase
MTVAIYARVSTATQTHRSQIAELTRWVDVNAGKRALWFRDKAIGTTMERPGWAKLWRAVETGQIARIVVWRIDRLGRTARGLTELFEELQRRNVGLVSLREGIDLSTPSGRVMANIVASIAQFETEVRSERQRAGIAAARAAGVRWGGRKQGTRVKLTAEKEAAIRNLHASGESISAIARTVGLSRPTIYRALRSAV